MKLYGFSERGLVNALCYDCIDLVIELFRLSEDTANG